MQSSHWRLYTRRCCHQKLWHIYFDWHHLWWIHRLYKYQTKKVDLCTWMDFYSVNTWDGKKCQNIPLSKQKISCMNSCVFLCQFQKVVNCPWMLDSTLPCKINPSWLLEFMRIPSYVSIDNSGPVSEMLHSGWYRPKLISFHRSRFWEKCCSKVYVLLKM